ncbi:MAG: hypothetical protein SFW67_23870 [Myxococcaceae bacterium]|nr:hypothetical protein [Myxococcaceae bacterium]
MVQRDVQSQHSIQVREARRTKPFPWFRSFERRGARMRSGARVFLAVERASVRLALEQQLVEHGFELCGHDPAEGPGADVWVSDLRSPQRVGALGQALRAVTGRRVPLVLLAPPGCALEVLRSLGPAFVVTTPMRWCQLEVALEVVLRDAQAGDEEARRLASLHRRLGYRSLMVFGDGAAWDPLAFPATSRALGDVFDVELFSMDDEVSPALLRDRVSDTLLEGVVARTRPLAAQHWLVFREAHDAGRERELLDFAARHTALGALAAGVVHEANDPLAYLQANLNYAADVLRAEGYGGDLPQAIDEARDGAGRITSLLGDLREVLGQHPEQSRPLDVHDLLAFAMRVTSQEWKHRAAVVVSPGPAPLVVSSPVRLSQVFINLLIVAGRLLVLANTPAARLEVATGHDEGGALEVRVGVRCHGEPAGTSMRHALSRYLDHAGSVGDFASIGLAVARAIAVDLGGEFSVDAGPDWFEVRVTVPSLGSMPLRTHPPRVLWVGPSFESAELRRRLLSCADEGMWVPAVSSPDERVRARSFDLVFVSSASEGHSLRRTLNVQPFTVTADGGALESGHWYVRSGAQLEPLAWFARRRRAAGPRPATDAPREVR